MNLTDQQIARADDALLAKKIEELFDGYMTQIRGANIAASAAIA